MAQNWSSAAADCLPTRIAAVLWARCLVQRCAAGAARDAGTPFSWAACLQARRSNNSPRESHSRSITGSVVEMLQRNLSRRRFQGISKILEKRNTPWRKAFGEAPAKEDLQHDSCRLHACICKKPLATQDLHHRISEQDLCSLHQVHKRSPGKISVRGLLARSQQISMQCLYTRPQKPLLSSPALCTRSPKEVSWQDPCTRSL